MREQVALRNEQELAEWQARRDAAADERRWQDEAADLPCARNRLVFEWAEETPEAARQAKLICNTACPVQELCLRRTLRLESGLRGFQRAGIVAGLTGKQRARKAREAGCAVCTLPLVEDASRDSLYCPEHGVKGARAAALAGGAA